MIPFETLINNLEEAIFLFDMGCGLIYLNKTAEEFLGTGLKELKDKGCKDLFPRAKDISMLLQKTITEGRSFDSKEMETDLGRPMTIDVNLSPFYIDNNLEGAILCVREHRPLSEREDTHFDSLLYLLGSIAHEVKNPLSGIKGAAQLLRESIHDQDAKECVNLIVREADRLNSVLHSYLTMTRNPVFNQVNIHEIIEYALKVLDTGIKENDVRVEKSYDPSLPTISGDESKLLQVFINLLKNALEALEASRRPRVLKISTRPSNEYTVIYRGESPDKKHTKTKKQRWVVITLQDTGKGIPKDEINKIFLPFYTTKGEGSGLGLALSKKIIRDHGGIIKVRSAAKDGTTFSIFLPYE